MTDPVWCPACKCMGFIAEGAPNYIHLGLPVALEGHTVQCGCPAGSNRLIATDSFFDVEEGGVGRISPDLAASAQAATHKWAKALRGGVFSNAYTGGIPRHEVRGLAPNHCVFAKSCTVPHGSTEAGTTTESVGNFGRVSVLGTVERKDSAGQGAAVGTMALGRVAGQTALEGLGSWSLRGAGAAASTLLLALWPSDTGDSALYSEDELRHLSAAATRVRFQFRRGADAVVRVYGLHSGNGSVPVVEANWIDGKRAMEARLGGVTISRC